VNWELIEEGVSVNSGFVNGFSEVIKNIQPLQDMYGDPNRIRPFTYLLRATAGYNTGSGDVLDSTPVNIRFTVVPDDDISKFLRNVQSDDNQPIKEFDNP